MADIFKQRRENVEKHVVESEPLQPGESTTPTNTNYTKPVLKDSNYKVKEVKVTQITPVITPAPVKQGDVVETKRDVSPKYLLSKSTPDVRMDTTSVSSISVGPLRTEGQAPQSSRQIQLHRAATTTTPSIVGAGKENIQPHLRKAKTFDLGIMLKA